MSSLIFPLISKIKPDDSGLVNDFEAFKALLAELISYETVSSHNPNEAESTSKLASDIASALKQFGAKVSLIDADYPQGVKQNTIIARFGAEAEGGVVFSGHMDVIPARGQNGWDSDPFVLTQKDDRLIGRGATDMKGAVCAYIAMSEKLRSMQLKKPVYFAFSWGEEIGCCGNDHLLEGLKKMGAKPDIVVVGEPTDGLIITGHKGGGQQKAVFKGSAGHSAYPKEGVSAIKYAAKFVESLTLLEEKFEKDIESHDKDFYPSYHTINVGVIAGGKAANVICDHAEVLFNARFLAGRGGELFCMIREQADILNKQMQEEALQVKENKNLDYIPKVGVELIDVTINEGLIKQNDNPKLKRTVEIFNKTEGNDVAHNPLATKAYLTDAGGISHLYKNDETLVIVCGPGGILQNAHAPNEWITVEQFKNSLKFPMALVWEYCL
ncbi:MAG: hypothetical protein COV35_06905 [Alphaproteobacteria bacterium CG11_big_fil_rev_8_21_14_0_20_39_49]|nr:MAG: hypothetical protein COV35_06905 [Alphaproteobacteria bacterium CG11_big_fil_rev_8_21_14_0_20_39_49]